MLPFTSKLTEFWFSTNLEFLDLLDKFNAKFRMALADQTESDLTAAFNLLVDSDIRNSRELRFIILPQSLISSNS
jgi:hypothetical protein